MAACQAQSGGSLKSEAAFMAEKGPEIRHSRRDHRDPKAEPERAGVKQEWDSQTRAVHAMVGPHDEPSALCRPCAARTTLSWTKELSVIRHPSRLHLSRMDAGDDSGKVVV